MKSIKTDAMKDVVQELREKSSRDNRDLLDRAADEIEILRADVECLKRIALFLAEKRGEDESPKR